MNKKDLKKMRNLSLWALGIMFFLMMLSSYAKADFIKLQNITGGYWDINDKVYGVYPTNDTNQLWFIYLDYQAIDTAKCYSYENRAVVYAERHYLNNGSFVYGNTYARVNLTNSPCMTKETHQDITINGDYLYINTNINPSSSPSYVVHDMNKLYLSNLSVIPGWKKQYNYTSSYPAWYLMPRQMFFLNNNDNDTTIQNNYYNYFNSYYWNGTKLFDAGKYAVMPSQSSYGIDGNTYIAGYNNRDFAYINNTMFALEDNLNSHNIFIATNNGYPNNWTMITKDSGLNDAINSYMPRTNKSKNIFYDISIKNDTYGAYLLLSPYGLNNSGTNNNYPGNETMYFMLWNITQESKGDFSTLPDGFYEFENTIFSPIQCISNDILCYDTSFYEQGFYSSDGLGQYGLRGYCYTNDYVTCQNGCDTYIENSGVITEPYITGYCAPTNYTAPAGLETCIIRGDYYCTAGRSYKICDDFDGDGWMTYENANCDPNYICSGGLSEPCVPVNVTAWSFVDYNFAFTPYIPSNAEQLLDNATKTGFEYGVTGALYSIGKLIGAYNPFIGIPIQRVSNEAGKLTVDALSGLTSGFKATYTDTLSAQSYTSLNCRYSQNISLNDNVYRNINTAMYYNFSAKSNSEVYVFDINATSPDNFTSINLSLSNGITNQADLTLQIDKNSKTFEIYYSGNSSLLTTATWSGYDDLLGAHIELNYNKPTNTYTIESYYTTSPLSDGNDYISDYSFSAPILNNGANPTVLILTPASSDTFGVWNFIRFTRSELAGYTTSTENNPDAYICTYFNSGCYYARLYSSASNQPVYHNYKDIYTCQSLYGIDTISGTTTAEQETNNALGGLFSGMGSGEKILWASLILILIMIFFVILGAVSGMFGLMILVGGVIDIIALIGLTIIGLIPGWILILIIIIASGITALFMKNIFLNDGGG